MNPGNFMMEVLLVNIGIGGLLLIVDTIIKKHPSYGRMKEMRVILILYRDVATVILIPAFLTLFTEINQLSQQLWMLALMFAGLVLDWWLIRTIEYSYSIEDINKYVKENIKKI